MDLLLKRTRARDSVGRNSEGCEICQDCGCGGGGEGWNEVETGAGGDGLGGDSAASMAGRIKRDGDGRKGRRRKRNCETVE